MAYAMLEQALTEWEKPMVIDADGLNLLVESPKLQKCLEDNKKKAGDRGQQIVLTPHLAEFARLYGCSVQEAKEDILHKPKELADRYGCTVVCKDARTAAAFPASENIYLNVSGNDGMAAAGTGDVLAGIIGGLMAQGMEAAAAAALGVYVHGRAGDKAAEEKGRYALMAGDVIDCLRYGRSSR